MPYPLRICFTDSLKKCRTFLNSVCFCIKTIFSSFVFFRRVVRLDCTFYTIPFPSRWTFVVHTLYFVVPHTIVIPASTRVAYTRPKNVLVHPSLQRFTPLHRVLGDFLSACPDSDRSRRIFSRNLSRFAERRTSFSMRCFRTTENLLGKEWFFVNDKTIFFRSDVRLINPSVHNFVFLQHVLKTIMYHYVWTMMVAI